MSNPKTKKHMSNHKTKSDSLPSLQKLIVLHLAKSESQTINETVTALSKSYKPTWIAFNSLENKGLIVKTDQKQYRGRKYDRYWLTDEGMITAIMEGCNTNKLLEQAKGVYPSAEIAHCFLEIMPVLDPEVKRIFFSSIKGKGKIGLLDLATLSLSQASIPDVETVKRFTQTLKKYPNQYQQLRQAVLLMIEQLKQLIDE